MEQEEMRMQVCRRREKGIVERQGGQEASKAEGRVHAGATEALVSLQFLLPPLHRYPTNCASSSSMEYEYKQFVNFNSFFFCVRYLQVPTPPQNSVKVCPFFFTYNKKLHGITQCYYSMGQVGRNQRGHEELRESAAILDSQKRLLERKAEAEKNRRE